MNTDWLDQLIEMEKTNEKNAREDLDSLAKEHPETWLREQLAADEDQSYTRIDDKHYRAAAIKKGSYVKTDVEMDEEGLLRIRTTLNIVATEETEADFRLYQMYENATFQTAGYLPAKAGDPITFEVRMRPAGHLDVSKLVKQCTISTALQTEKFDAIRKGRSAVDICRSNHKEKVEAALNAFGR